MRIMLNHLNQAILLDIARVARKIADRGMASGTELTKSYEYIDADTLTVVLHEIREKLGDLDVDQSIKEGE